MAEANFLRLKVLELIEESGQNFVPICCKIKHFNNVQEELRSMRDEGLIFGFRCFTGLPGDYILTIAVKDDFKEKETDLRLLYLTNDWEAERELPIWNL